jgi:hypothetical protein
MNDVYKKAAEVIKKDSRDICKNFAKELDKKIPADTPHKYQLITIVLSCDISSRNEAISVLEGKLKYLKNNPDKTSLKDDLLDSCEFHKSKYSLFVTALKCYLK